MLPSPLWNYSTILHKQQYEKWQQSLRYYYDIQGCLIKIKEPLQSDFYIIILLFSYLSISINNIFRCRQFCQSHRPSGMELLGADADFCPKSKL